MIFGKSTNQKSLLNVGLIFFYSVLLSSCQIVKSEIASFSTLPTNTQNETFFIVSSDEQALSAEFLQYASSISKRLEMKSWYRVTEPSEAKYLMFLDYGVAGSSTKVFSHNDEDDIVSSTRHHRYFQITVIDAISETPVYEIKVASRGKSSTFGAVAECIFEMALKDFPQQLTTKESIMMDNCGTQ